MSCFPAINRTNKERRTKHGVYLAAWQKYALIQLKPAAVGRTYFFVPPNCYSNQNPR